VSDETMSGIRTLEGFVTYRDGSEDRIVEILGAADDRSSDSDELASKITDWPTRYHLSRLRANLLRPLRLGAHHRVLEVGAGTGVLSRYLGETGARVVALEGQIDRARAAALRCAGLANVEVVCGPLQSFEDPDGFDLVCIVGVLEYAASGVGGAQGHRSFLDHAIGLLRPGGALLVAIENQIGLKYLLGYHEDHLGLAWIGLEGYPGSHGIRTFSRSGLGRMLGDAGLDHQKWFYPFPDYKLPTLVLTDELYREADAVELVDQLARDPVRDDGSARSLLCDARRAHRVLLEAGLGPEVSNSFLVLACSGDRTPDLLPDAEVLAWRMGDERRRRWCRRLAIHRADGGLRIATTMAGPDLEGRSEEWLEQRPGKDQPYHRGQTCEQMALRACLSNDPDGLSDTLGRWSAHLDELSGTLSAADPPHHPFMPATDELVLPPEFLDLALSNFVVQPDGLRFIDDEWRAQGGVSARLAKARALWLFARDLVCSGADHPWVDELTVDQLATRLGEMCGVAIDGELLERMVTAEVELQTLVTGRDRDSLRRDHEWLGAASRATSELSSELPYTRLERQIARQHEQVRELEERGHRREEELQQQLSELGQSHQRAHDDLAHARSTLQAREGELGAAKSELDAARAEVEMLHRWRAEFERRLPVRLYKRLRRLVSR
jgi:SAM-dependent methyltransferase